MCDQTKIEHELASISGAIGDIRNYDAWAEVIRINLQQMGVACLADLTVAQLLRVIADAEHVMAGLDDPTDMLEAQHAH